MKHIIILGGGFGGIRVALELLKSKKDFKIMLVNNSPFHSFHPDLYEVATAKVSGNDKLTFENLMGTVNIPLSRIFGGKKIEILIDAVKAIDLDKKEVTLNQSKLEFDYLVMALGSTTNYMGISGAKDYSHPLKNTEDALNIRNDLCELGLGSRVVIAGGGFTGAELAGLLTNFLKDKVNLSIIEASDHLLNDMPQWAQVAAENRLKNLGVTLNLGCKILSVDQKNIYCADGEKIGYDYLIWTGGVIGTSIEGGIKEAKLNNRGQIKVSDDLTVAGQSGVWAVGDMAEVLDKNGNPVPQTAWAAISQAKIAAKNIVSESMNKPKISYKTPNAQFIVPVGPRYALGNIFNLKIHGVLAWFVKMYIALNYMLSILPLFLALQEWWKGVKIRINE